MAPTRRAKRKTAPFDESSGEEKRSISRRRINKVSTAVLASDPYGDDQANVAAVAESNAAIATVASQDQDGEEVQDAVALDPPVDAAAAPKKRSRRAAKSKAKAVESDKHATVAWNQMLFKLILWKSEKGDVFVKASDTEHKDLHQWMKQQRDQYKLYQEDPESSALTKEQIAVLDYMQFPWLVRGQELWKRNYERLKEFKAKHGHTLVSKGDLQLPKLGDWVTEQRRQYKLKMEGKTSTLTPEKQALLDQLDMVWKVRDRPGWDKRFAELLEFKEKHGHAKVPQHYSENRPLGKWVAKQREQFRFYRTGKHSFLTPDRIEQLNSVGFIWNCKGKEPVKDVIAEAEAAAPSAEAATNCIEAATNCIEAAAPVTIPTVAEGEAATATIDETAVNDTIDEEAAVEEAAVEEAMSITLETEETLAAEANPAEVSPMPATTEDATTTQQDVEAVAVLTREAVATAEI